MTRQKTALILGATGGIGGEVARTLKSRGWRIRALHRKGGAARLSGDGFDWVQGDAMNEADVVAAAMDVAVIVHAVNPPGYRNWSKLVLPMLNSTVAAAKASGARIVFPGTVYNFGPDAWPNLREDSPQNPKTRKGSIRVEMERRLKAAAAEGVRSLIVRAGDFFGPRGTSNSWFGAALIKPGKAPTSVSYPGRKGVGHQWAYLPDVAETMVLARKRGPARDLRSVPYGRPLGPGRNGDRRRNRPGLRQAEHEGDGLPLAGGHFGFALRDHVPRDAGNALSLARAAAHGQ
jgi:nucleoside-diphosphate-sugar epimerase